MVIFILSCNVYVCLATCSSGIRHSSMFTLIHTCLLCWPRRSIPTTSNDRIYCKILAHNAVHAAFAGYTGITVGLVNTHYVYLPIPVIIQAPRRVDPRGKMWNRLRASIGQPNFY